MKLYNIKKIYGAVIVIFAIIFVKMETDYFGNNFLPESNEELICDITALILSVSGHILFWQKRKTD